MADISKIKLPNGTIYDVKDATARTDLANKLNVSLKGAAGGLAELDSSGKVPSSQLPSYVNYLGEITDVDNILNNPEYGDCPYEGIISSDVATSIGLSSDIDTEWSIKCFRATEGSGFQIAVPIYNSSKTPKYRIAAKHSLNGSGYVIGWENWKNFSDGGNADTVDGKHASDFVDVNDNETQIEIPSDTNNPIDVPLWIKTNGKRYTRYFTYNSTGYTNVPNNSGTWVWYYFDGNNIIAREYITDNVWTATVINGTFTGWKLINSSDADTVDGLHANEIASNPNLLDNPDFKINQRGESVYSQSSKGPKMSIDRWAIYKHSSTETGDITLTPASSGGLVLNNQTDGKAAMYQRIENFSDLFGKQITFSASINGSILSLTATCTNATAQIGDTVFTDDQSAYLRIWAVLDTYIQFEIYLNAGASITVDWVKVEIGGVATPFCPPNPATELAKCQRYLWVVQNKNLTYLRSGVEIAWSENLIKYYLYSPAEFRQIPTLTYENICLGWIKNGSTQFIPTSIKVDQYSNIIRLSISIDSKSPLTIGEVYEIASTGTSYKLIFSAEL